MQDHIISLAQRLCAAGRAACGKAVDVTQYGTQLHHCRGALADGCRHACGSGTAERAAPPECGQLPLHANRWCAADYAKHYPDHVACMSAGRQFTAQHRHVKVKATCIPNFTMYDAGSAACTQLSTLCKLTSLTAGQRPSQCLQTMLPALRVLKRLQCDVPFVHDDDSGPLPVLSRLTALEELHMTSSLVGDYRLEFPPSLQVNRHSCMQLI